MQHAGSHLKQLQKAMKSGNVGIILGEAAKRAKRSVGLRQADTLAGVHPNLTLQAQLTSKVNWNTQHRQLKHTYYINYNILW